MKRILSVLTASAMALVMLASPITAQQSESEIYSDGASGETVVRFQLRLRELGYLFYRPTGVYRSMTVDAVKAFQLRASDTGERILIDGRLGAESIARLFSNDAPRAKIPDQVHIPRGPLADALKVTGELVEWGSVKAMLSVGNEYSVMDCNTGESFRLVYTGGDNHAEMELYSTGDRAAFDKISGDEYNFLKRPVVVNVNGKNIAASLQCWPHGAQERTDNGMEGHVCVFFEGSLSNVGSLPDSEHAAVVLQAAGR